MKNIFPKADEMLLLDVLASADNNVQIASEKLIAMGYTKRDFISPKVNNRTEMDVHGRVKKPGDEKIIPLRPKEYSEQEKESMKIRLKEKYNQIAEYIILMALESVNYSEDRAIQILQIVQEEDETREKKATGEAPNDLNQLNNNITTTDGLIDPSTSSGVTEKVITVLLETTMNIDQSNNMDAAPKAEQQPQQKQRLLPSINVTTPSTTTTQIILSHSPNHLNENENQKKESQQQKSLENTLSSATTKTLTSSLSTTSSSSSSSYQTITTKSILERCNTNETGISGYLQKHGCSPASSNNNNKNKNKTTITTTNITTSNTNTPDSILDKLKLSRSRDKSHSLKNSPRDSTEDDTDLAHRQEFKSLLGRITTMGHNVNLAKGPDDSILLADYVTWNGANPDISVGHKQAAAGPDLALLSERSYLANGRNPELCKGPKVGLAKGSIYAQLKCN